MLDQCEHLADACAVMADALLRGCPDLRIIATSRHVLGVTGEVTVAVPPMTVPADGPARGARGSVCSTRRCGCSPTGPRPCGRGSRWTRSAARRWPASAAGWTGSRWRSSWPRSGCARLSPGQILSRLDSRLRLLSGGGPASQPHHRTLAGRAGVELWPADRGRAEHVAPGVGVRRVLRPGRRRGGVRGRPGSAAGEIVDLIDALVAKSILLRTRATARPPVPAAGHHRRVRSEQGPRAGATSAGYACGTSRWYAALAARQEAFGPGPGPVDRRPGR